MLNMFLICTKLGHFKFNSYKNLFTFNYDFDFIDFFRD